MSALRMVFPILYLLFYVLAVWLVFRLRQRKDLCVRQRLATLNFSSDHCYQMIV